MSIVLKKRFLLIEQLRTDRSSEGNQTRCRLLTGLSIHGMPAMQVGAGRSMDDGQLQQKGSGRCFDTI